MLGGFIFSALVGAALGWLIHEIAFAPLGYEDATGFHYGRPDGGSAFFERGR